MEVHAIFSHLSAYGPAWGSAARDCNQGRAEQDSQLTGALGLMTTLGLRLLGLDGVPGPPAEA